MSGAYLWRRAAALAALGGLFLATPAVPQTGRLPSRTGLRLEPIAETRLLMEGLNMPNFRGLERVLKQKPDDVEAWTFARGQALLIAESGNLLMLRPPKSNGLDAWMERAAELREAATALARSAASRDYERSRTGMNVLAESCNRCHQSFRVQVRIVPFGEPAQRERTP